MMLNTGDVDFGYLVKVVSARFLRCNVMVFLFVMNTYLILFFKKILCFLKLIGRLGQVLFTEVAKVPILVRKKLCSRK